MALDLRRRCQGVAEAMVRADVQRFERDQRIAEARLRMGATHLRDFVAWCGARGREGTRDMRDMRQPPATHASDYGWPMAGWPLGGTFHGIRTAPVQARSSK